MRELIAIASTATGLADLVRRAVAARVGAFAGHIPVTDEMMQAAVAGRDLVAAMVAREPGIRPDVTAVDVLRLIELFSRGPRFDPHTEDRLLAIALGGLLPSVGGLPGPRPTLRDYRARWSPKPPPP